MSTQVSTGIWMLGGQSSAEMAQLACRAEQHDVAANADRIRDEEGYSTPVDWPAEWAEVVELVTGATREARRP